jgi:hypothetical protein
MNPFKFREREREKKKSIADVGLSFRFVLECKYAKKLKHDYEPAMDHCV